MTEEKRASFDKLLEQKQNPSTNCGQSQSEEFWSKDPYFHHRLGEKADTSEANPCSPTTFSKTACGSSPAIRA